MKCRTEEKRRAALGMLVAVIVILASGLLTGCGYKQTKRVDLNDPLAPVMTESWSLDLRLFGSDESTESKKVVPSKTAKSGGGYFK